jgi:hypothetical protein
MRRARLFLVILAASGSAVALHVVQYHGAHWGLYALAILLLVGCWPALGEAGCR